MRFGSVHGAGFGSPANQVCHFEPTLDENGNLTVLLRAAAGFGNAYFGIYANTVRIGMMYVPEGAVADGHFRVATGTTSVCVLRHGTLADYAMARPARSYEAANATRATLSWAWAPEILGTPDLATLTNWTLTGLVPSLTSTGQPQTRASLTATLEVADGAATVTLDNGGEPLASGTGAVGGTVTLTGTLTGSVAVDGAATSGTTPLLFRFPFKMEVLRGATNPPTTVVAAILYTGKDTSRWTEPTDLAAGTYYYRIRPTSDTGETGVAGSTSTVVIPGPPAAPTNLHYDSGNAAATVIHWTASTTAGATYRLYLQPIGAAFMDLNTYTTIAAGQTSATLAAIVGYPGTVRLILRAVNGGVEEPNLSVLSLEYDAAGNYVAPRPNMPTLGSLSVQSGLSVSIQGAYSPYGEKGTPTKLQLFSRTPSGTYNFASADAEGTLGAESGGLRVATISKTYLTAGWLYLTLKAATAAGVQSENYAPEVLVYVSAASTAAPTLSAEASRG